MNRHEVRAELERAWGIFTGARASREYPKRLNELQEAVRIVRALEDAMGALSAEERALDASEYPDEVLLADQPGEYLYDFLPVLHDAQDTWESIQRPPVDRTEDPFEGDYDPDYSARCAYERAQDFWKA